MFLYLNHYLFMKMICLKLTPEAEQWIEDVVNIFVSNLIDASGKKLIDKFISNNNFAADPDIEENEL